MCYSELLALQADVMEESKSQDTSLSTNQIETTHFVDVTKGLTEDYTVTPREIETADVVSKADLDQFLSRPVRIWNFTWNETDAVHTMATINPWTAFFGNSYIKYKLNNFAFIRANLRLNIVVNASPFYYGAMRFAYFPLAGVKTDTIIAEPSTYEDLIPYSQRPGVWISPQHSEGAEIVLPFIWNKNMIALGSSTGDIASLGTLTSIVYSQLRSANGVTGQGVTVQVFASAENVVLSGATVGLAMQSDEYQEDGAISGPASAVASFAGYFKRYPVLNRFATVTEYAARTVAGVAKFFGFTNVPVIEDYKPVRNSAFPAFASSEIGFPVDKLTLDPKNELAVDPQASGFAEDELMINHLATKPSFLVRVPWLTTDTVDTPLFTSRVTPAMLAVGSVGTHFTPMAMISHLFRNWRGDIIFTFKFVCSPFHKGRVRISYDPVNSTIQTTADTGPLAYNTIVDLTSDTEVEMRIPYQQALAWLNFNPTYETPYTVNHSPTLTLSQSFHNGMISMKVLTLLTAPVASAPVDVLVFVRAADNIEFNNPTMTSQFYSRFAQQSEEKTEDIELMKQRQEISECRNRVNWGETIGSLRHLLRRTNYYTTVATGTTTLNKQNLVMFINHRLPRLFGYSSYGTDQAKGLTATGTTFTFNWTAQSPLTWLYPAFLGYKGAMIWYANPRSNDAAPVESIRIARYNEQANTGPTVITVTQTDATTRSQAAGFYITNGKNTSAGTALTNVRTQAGVGAYVPNMTNYKFCVSTDNLADHYSDDSQFDQMLVSYTVPTTAGGQDVEVDLYYGIGTDFNLHGFLNAPSYYLYSGFPNAV